MMVKDGFSKNKLARGESWNRSTLFYTYTALTTVDRTRQMHVIIEQSEQQALRLVRRETKHGCCFSLLDLQAKLSGKSVIAEMKKDGAIQ